MNRRHRLNLQMFADKKRKFYTVEEFKQAKKDGVAIESVPVRAPFIAEIAEAKAPDGAPLSLTLIFAISSIAVDRDGDTIDPMGWKLDNYMKNPVVLWAHDGSSPPIAKSLSTFLQDGKLKSSAEFTPRDLNPFGYMIYEMYKQGFMNATSVGFMPLKYVEAADRAGWFPMDFKEQELLEYSAVPVPSNPEAIVEARSAGVDVEPLLGWAEKTLDTWGQQEGLWVPRKDVEGIYKLLDKSGKTFSFPSGPTPEPEPEVAKIKLSDGEEVALPDLEKAWREKAGRTLSAANETKIRDAVSAIGTATEALSGVLAALDKGDSEEGGQENIQNDTNSDKHAILLGEGLAKFSELIARLEKATDEPAEDVLVLSDEVAADEPVLILADDPDEPTVLRLADEQSTEGKSEAESLKTMVKDAFAEVTRELKMSMTGRID